MAADGNPQMPMMHTVRVGDQTWERIQVLQELHGLTSAVDVVDRLTSEAVSQIDPKSIATRVEERLKKLLR